MKTYLSIVYTAFLLAGILSFLGCGSSKATLKTFVDPSIQSSSITSIATFPLRNTALSPGEAVELNRAMATALMSRNNSIKIIGATEATRMLNESELVEEYSRFLYDYEHSGIPNIATLNKIGKQLGVDAIMQGSLSGVEQRDGEYGRSRSKTALTLRYTLMSTSNGSTIWEGTSTAQRSGGTTLSKSAPLYQVIDMAHKKLLTGLPTLAK